LLCTRLNRQGPINKPAMISPTTWGALHLRATRAKNLALNIMIAKSRNTEYTKTQLLSKPRKPQLSYSFNTFPLALARALAVFVTSADFLCTECRKNFF